MRMCITKQCSRPVVASLQVVLMNQVTTKLTNGQNPALAPALGEFCGRILLPVCGLEMTGSIRNILVQPLICRLCLNVNSHACTGDSWAQTATDRIDLRWDGQGRLATLAKPPHTPPAGLKFAVIAGGARGTVFKRKEAAE